MSIAIGDVILERRRQQFDEKFSTEHDDGHKNGELAYAAAAYAQRAACALRSGTQEVYEEPPNCWPWGREWWKPKDSRRDLVRAAALLIAEIERIDRVERVK